MPETKMKQAPGGMYTQGFIKVYRALFRPLSRLLKTLGIGPNTVTLFSFVFACVTCYFLAVDRLWLALAFGLAMGFADTVDGQIAKEFGMESKFGGVLDSTVDRYCEFMVYLGFGLRYYYLGRPLWIVGCAMAFAGSVMISYIKARAEADGYSCKVGRLQRPERLTIVGFGCLFLSHGVDVMIIILAFGTQMTAFQRLMHVYRQSVVEN